LGKLYLWYCLECCRTAGGWPLESTGLPGIVTIPSFYFCSYFVKSFHYGITSQIPCRGHISQCC